MLRKNNESGFMEKTRGALIEMFDQRGMEKEALVVFMHDTLGYTPEQISMEQGLPPATTLETLYKGRIALLHIIDKK